MIGDRIRVEFDKLPPSIKIMAGEYKEGRNVLIRCLSRSAKQSEISVIHWLKSNHIPIKDINNYKIVNER